MELGSLRPFSDIAGRHTIRLDNSSQRRQELAQRLQQSGCSVSLEGTDWHSAGDFEAALVPVSQDDSNPTARVKTPTYGGIVALSGDAANLLVEAMEKQATRNTAITVTERHSSQDQRQEFWGTGRPAIGCNVGNGP